MPTLFDYYKKKGQNLPSLSERSKLYESQGLGAASTYSGTAQQNTSLLGRLTSGGAGGESPAPASVNPALSGAGNQNPNRPGAATIPTPEESRMNTREAIITKSTDPQERLISRIMEQQSQLPSQADILSKEREAAGIPDLNRQIADTQSVIDRITQRLSGTIRFEEDNRQIPLGLLRGRQREAELQAAQELQPFETRLGRLTGQRQEAGTLASEMSEARFADAQRPLQSAERQLELQQELQPGRDLIRDMRLQELEPQQEQQPEYRTLNRSLVRINPDGTVENVFTAPTAPTGGGGRSTPEVTNEDKVNQYFTASRGSDNYVSPDDWAAAKSAWIEDGGSPTVFDSKFKGWKNPQNKNYK